MLSTDWPDFLRKHWAQMPGLFQFDPPLDWPVSCDVVFDLFAAHSEFDHDFTTFEAPGPGGRERLAECWLQGIKPTSATFESLADHSMLMVRGIQRFVPAIQASLQEWQRLFSVKVNANLYLSTKGTSGFRIHADTHHVFAAQIEGEKDWRLWPPVHDTPMRGFSLPSLESHLGESQPTRYSTSPNQCLYLPMGWPHDAATPSGHSLHITIGINPPRWLDVLNESLREVAAQAGILRHAIPLHFEEDRIQWIADRQDVKALLALVEELIQKSERDDSIVWPGCDNEM